MDCWDEQGQMGPVRFPSLLAWVLANLISLLLLLLLLSRLSRVRLFATPWTAAHQASPSMGFSRQEYWSGVPLPSLPHFTTVLLFQN